MLVSGEFLTLICVVLWGQKKYIRAFKWVGNSRIRDAEALFTLIKEVGGRFGEMAMSKCIRGEKKIVQWRVHRYRQVALSRVSPYQPLIQRSSLPIAMLHA